MKTLSSIHYCALALLLLAGLSSGCGSESKSESENAEKTGRSAVSEAVNAPMDYLGAQGRALRSAERTVAVLEIAPAIQQFQAIEGRLPARLEELVEQGYLRALPQAPSGQQFVYNPQTGELRAVPAGAIPSGTPPTPSVPRVPGR